MFEKVLALLIMAAIAVALFAFQSANEQARTQRQTLETIQ